MSYFLGIHSLAFFSGCLWQPHTIVGAVSCFKDTHLEERIHIKNQVQLSIYYDDFPADGSNMIWSNKIGTLDDCLTEGEKCLEEEFLLIYTKAPCGLVAEALLTLPPHLLSLENLLLSVP